MRRSCNTSGSRGGGARQRQSCGVVWQQLLQVLEGRRLSGGVPVCLAVLALRPAARTSPYLAATRLTGAPKCATGTIASILYHESNHTKFTRQYNSAGFKPFFTPKRHPSQDRHRQGRATRRQRRQRRSPARRHLGGGGVAEKGAGVLRQLRELAVAWGRRARGGGRRRGQASEGQAVQGAWVL